MSLTAAFITFVSAFRPSSTDTTPTGAAAVKQAFGEMQDISEVTFEATLGEPDIQMPANHDFVREPKVVVPVRDVPYGDGGEMAFDFPNGDGDSLFERLLDAHGLSMGSIEQLDGVTVPVFYEGGNPVVDWYSLEDSDEETREESSE